MNAKQSDPDRYSYSALETAIGVVFGVDEAGQRGWLRITSKISDGLG